jgi:hypothetical protein
MPRHQRLTMALHQRDLLTARAVDAFGASQLVVDLTLDATQLAREPDDDGGEGVACVTDDDVITVCVVMLGMTGCGHRGDDFADSVGRGVWEQLGDASGE